MTLLGFMCPGLGKSIKSWVLSHHAINKLYDMSPLSHSPSLDQLPLLCTPLVFATYHMIYLHHNIHTYHSLCIAPHLHLPLAPCPLPPSLHYLFTYLAILSGCIQLDLVLFHSFSLIITNTPIHILLHYTLLHTCSHLHLHYTSIL